jgi:hypothetical protein
VANQKFVESIWEISENHMISTKKGKWGICDLKWQWACAYALHRYKQSLWPMEITPSELELGSLEQESRASKKKSSQLAINSISISTSQDKLLFPSGDINALTVKQSTFSQHYAYRTIKREKHLSPSLIL